MHAMIQLLYQKLLNQKRQIKTLEETNLEITERLKEKEKSSEVRHTGQIEETGIFYKTEQKEKYQRKMENDEGFEADENERVSRNQLKRLEKQLDELKDDNERLIQMEENLSNELNLTKDQLKQTFSRIVELTLLTQKLTEDKMALLAKFSNPQLRRELMEKEREIKELKESQYNPFIGTLAKFNLLSCEGARKSMKCGLNSAKRTWKSGICWLWPKRTLNS